MNLPDFLVDRYKDWKENIFLEKEHTYKLLAKKGQKPNTMIVSCCDSRVYPSIIFKANEGEFFVHRNIANIIPSFNADKINHSTLSAIEYAIHTLKIKDLIILGHSNCGGIKHAYELFSGEIEKNNSFVDKWIENIKPVYNIVNKVKNEKKSA